MAHENRAAVAIPQPVIDAVTTSLLQIQAALAPYVIPLTAEERKTMGKMGDKTVAFVQKVADYTVSNAAFVPVYMSAGELQIDVTNARLLEPVLKLAEQVCNSLNDTAMVSGSEAYMNSLTYYNNVKQADKNSIANARQVYDDLAQRFPGRKKKVESATSLN